MTSAEKSVAVNPILRRAMLAANTLHVWIYRASRGKVAGSAKGMPILLLTVPGRQTKIPRTAPVGYLQHGDGWIVSGSAGGLRDEPQWFRNLRVVDHAVVEIGGATRDVTVTVAEGEPRETLWRQLVAAYPFFTGYQEKVTRQIPVAVLQVPAEPVAGSVAD
jgi:deazaflavin-dependent oxidoreductase (nitroreductase family)